MSEYRSEVLVSMGFILGCLMKHAPEELTAAASAEGMSPEYRAILKTLADLRQKVLDWGKEL